MRVPAHLDLRKLLRRSLRHIRRMLVPLTTSAVGAQARRGQNGGGRREARRRRRPQPHQETRAATRDKGGSGLRTVGTHQRARAATVSARRCARQHVPSRSARRVRRDGDGRVGGREQDAAQQQARLAVGGVLRRQAPPDAAAGRQAVHELQLFERSRLASRARDVHLHISTGLRAGSSGGGEGGGGEGGGSLVGAEQGLPGGGGEVAAVGGGQRAQYGMRLGVAAVQQQPAGRLVHPGKGGQEDDRRACAGEGHAWWAQGLS